MSEEDPGSKLKQEQSLPWWVELLFVQIGLPDKWLYPILKSRKKTTKLLRLNKKKVTYTLIALMAIIYFDPIVKKARIHNQCVANSKSYVLNTVSNQTEPEKEVLSAWANHFCNGGDL